MSPDPLRGSEQLIKRVYAYVAYRLGDGPDAEDVTSTVFEQALRYRSTYDASKGEPAAWLIGIARRCIASSLSTRPTEVLDSALELSADGDLEADTVERLSLTSALSRLGERDRELISLRYGADLKARDIAELLELTTNAVEVALHRALARLRAELAEPAEPRSTPQLDPLEKRM